MNDEKILKRAADLAAAVGVSRYTISAIRKTGRIINDPLPNYSTAGDVRRWLRRHPEFVARNAFKKDPSALRAPASVV